MRFRLELQMQQGQQPGLLRYQRQQRQALLRLGQQPVRRQHHYCHQQRFLRYQRQG
jgi:hypothetical protein